MAGLHFKLEVHVHTKYSSDSVLPHWLLYFMCRLRRITHIAITEHNNIDGGIAFKNYCAARGNKIHVIIGEEIMTQQGEIIGLFLHKTIKPGMHVKDTIDHIKAQKGLVYVPHPYDEKRFRTVLDEESIRVNRKVIDFIEVHNGRNYKASFSAIQNSIAERYGIKKIIGSDAHTFLEIGRNCILCSIAPDNRESFIGAIKLSRLEGKSCIHMVHMITRVVKVIKLLQKEGFYGLCRVFYKKYRREV